MRWFGWWLALVAFAACGRGADTPMPEIVVAIRYLQSVGNSHAHLYLYRADGKLLRQLTNDNGGQDSDPVFSPGGDHILFTRTLPGGGTQCWSIEPHGGDLHQVPAPPDWYAQTRSSPDFEHISSGPPIMPQPRSAPSDARVFTTEDGKTTGTITPAAGVDDPDAPDRWEVSLRAVDGGHAIKVGEMDGYSAGFLSGHGDEPGGCVLHDGILDVAFCFVHLNSSDGDTVYALDLSGRRLVRLSPNWAEPFPLPGEAAFLTWTENRYLPFGDGKRTANCSYIERWDAGLHRVRYARDAAPATCDGASMYRPGKTPATITIRSKGD